MGFETTWLASLGDCNTDGSSTIRRFTSQPAIALVYLALWIMNPVPCRPREAEFACRASRPATPDVIVAANGRPITQLIQLDEVFNQAEGQPIELDVMRAGRRVHL